MGASLSVRPVKPYRVTVSQTVTVMACNEQQAEQFGKEMVAYVGSDTEDVQAEELQGD